MFELVDKVLRYDNLYYIFVDPKRNQKNLRTSPKYQETVSGYFDLVCVQLNYPLEPNYVIIKDVPSDIDVNAVKDLNLEAADIEPLGIIAFITRDETYGNTHMQKCNVVFDFKEKEALAEAFARYVNEYCFKKDNLKTNESLLTVKRESHIYCRHVYAVQAMYRQNIDRH